ncbi:hypothetical protein Q8A73_012459 [Channa argus]|nr:hypothetical protein Q8A73_012459 [Channa argus]
MQENQDPDLVLQVHMSEMKEENDPDYINQSNTKEEQDPDFVHHGHFKSEMKEENQDPDFIVQDHYNSEIKEENQDSEFAHNVHGWKTIKEENLDPDFTDQGYCNSRIKEENEDPDFIKHEQSEIKEENQESDFIDQVLCKVEIKEENEDPDQQNSDPAGPSDSQLKRGCGRGRQASKRARPVSGDFKAQQERWHSKKGQDVESPTLRFEPKHSPGPRINTTVSWFPLSLFKLFFSSNVLPTITNTNATQRLARVVNSYILYKTVARTQNQTPMSYQQFREVLMREMVEQAKTLVAEACPPPLTNTCMAMYQGRIGPRDHRKCVVCVAEKKEKADAGVKSEEHEDPFTAPSHFASFLRRVQIEDLNLIHRDQLKRQIKEENQDVENQVQYKVELKEENKEPNFIHNDLVESGVKEGNQNPDFINQDPAGPSDQQINSDGLYCCSYANLGLSDF